VHSFLPTKVGAQVLRDQLQVKTRNMNGFGCITDYGLKSVAWMVFWCADKKLMTNFSRAPNSFGEKLEGTAPAVPKFFGRAGARPSRKFADLKPALKSCVINYLGDF
jgi:hypothetical protein